MAGNKKTTNSSKSNSKSGTRSSSTRSNTKTSTRTNSTKKNPKNVSASTRRKQEEERSFRSEIIVLAIAALLIILELSNFGLCGGVRVITDFFFGLFGIVQYVLPLYILIIMGFLYVNEGSDRSIKKAIFITLFVIGISVFAQLIRNPNAVSVVEIFKDSMECKLGGGFFGGGLAILLVKGIGVVGTYILMVFITIVVIMLITEVSIFDIIKDIKDYAASSSYEEDDDEFEDIDEPNRLKKNKKAEKSKSNGKRSVLGSIKVLSVEEDIFTEDNSDKLADEDVHEITMDYEFDDVNDLTVSTLNPVNNQIPVMEKPVSIFDKLPEVSADTEELTIEVEKPSRKKKTQTKADKEILEENTLETTKAINEHINHEKNNYVFPSINLLKKGSGSKGTNDAAVRATAAKLQSVLASFGINVTITDYSCGPAVTRYEMQPEQGVKVSKITGLADDIMLNLAADGIRIEAPIPGKAAIGIEIPNKENQTIMFRDLIEDDNFKKASSDISFAVGKGLSGETMVADIAKMPHLLIAGATGSGKSVCINTIIMSILYKAHPDDVKLIMIDPKVVELSAYNGIPHLLIPVVTEPKKAAGALNWAVKEMTDRYELFAKYNVRNIKGYNDKVKEALATGECDDTVLKKMPYIVVIVDELADLMMVAHGEVEDSIVRLSQLARAAGIHLVIATQRPSVDVITGLIKANVPSRIAFAVSSGVDSRTILDMIGAEKLLGKGDMLFYPTGYPKPVRVQGAFVSDDEVGSVVDFLKLKNGETVYSEDVKNKITSSSSSSPNAQSANDKDEYFVDAGRFIIEKDKASIGMLQRVYKIGFNRAARIMDQLADAGVVGEEEGTKPRKVLMSMEEFENFIEESL